jgi:hypothetical protein
MFEVVRTIRGYESVLDTAVASPVLQTAAAASSSTDAAIANETSRVASDSAAAGGDQRMSVINLQLC